MTGTKPGEYLAVFCSHESTKSYVVLHRWSLLGCLYKYVTRPIVENGRGFDTGWAIFALAHFKNKQYSNWEKQKTSCSQLKEIFLYKFIYILRFCQKVVNYVNKKRNKALFKISIFFAIPLLKTCFIIFFWN